MGFSVGGAVDLVDAAIVATVRRGEGARTELLRFNTIGGFGVAEAGEIGESMARGQASDLLNSLVSGPLDRGSQSNYVFGLARSGDGELLLGAIEHRAGGTMDGLVHFREIMNPTADGLAATIGWNNTAMEGVIAGGKWIPFK